VLQDVCKEISEAGQEGIRGLCLLHPAFGNTAIFVDIDNLVVTAILR
jgi:hypothetical protein